MARIYLAALGAAMLLGACSPPEITSRLDTNEAFGSGFADADSYTPRPVGARADNDFLRFSTLGIPQ